MNDFMPVVVGIVNAILMTLLPVLAAALIAAVVGWTRKEFALLKQAQPQLCAQMEMYAKIAVAAAEQAGAADIISDKKEYAIDIVSGWLEQTGWGGVNVNLIAAEIERQVREMKLSAPSAG